MNRTTVRRMTAGVGAVALALVGLGVGVSAAHAAVGPDQPGAPTAGTLTINKYAGLPVSAGNSPDPTDLLDGVEFTVTQVGVLNAADACVAIDLTEAAEWDGLEGLFSSAPAAPAAPFCLTTVTQDEVTEEGQAGFNLDLGVYYVQETDAGDNPIVSPVPNFYVSIPTADDGVAGGWNYSVVANPKNQLMVGPSKTITAAPSALAVGSEVTWTISVPVPTLAAGETFTTGSLTDVLDSRLAYVSSTVEIDDEPFAHTVNDGVVTWNFNTAALAANQGKTITITLVTEVLSVGNGQIINAGGEDGNYWSEFNEAVVPGGTSPETYWGQLSILKTDNPTPDANRLEGAEFQVFDLAEGATCAVDAPGTGAVATGTSDTNGVVQWEGSAAAGVLGLWIANIEDGPATPVPTKDYCVYETVVPAGHTATPIANPVTIQHGEALTHALTVVNLKKDGPDLPLTGAQGTLAMTIGGLVLISIGAGAIVLSKRRRESAAV